MDKPKSEGKYSEFNNFSELLEGVKSYNQDADIDKIRKACEFAYDAHKEQKRASGEPYFLHCYEVAKILTSLKMDSHSIIVGLLHDVIEDTQIKDDVIEKTFDTETLELVKSVTKLDTARGKFDFESPENMRAENIRKVLLATSKDVRVIIIKLADRLHNLRTLKHLPEHKRKVIAQETMDIYAPIAQKLGMNSIKAELEDLCFRFLQPKLYQGFKARINKKREQREDEVKDIMKDVQADLKTNNVEAKVQGRAKHFYSIFKKIHHRNKEFSEIYDLIAIRIITPNIKDCYTALGVVHKRWKPMPGKFKDYIAVPKSNGYQSLHTTVVGSHGRILEVQIRTKEMHSAAEEGIAAHWRYKGTETDKRFDRQIEWLKQILNWKRESGDASEFIENMKIDLFEREIFVFTPKGDTISLPERATPVDFAYAVHTDVGNHCSKSKINGKIMTLDTMLASGDVVEIVTQKNAKPSRSWLSFVQSTSARSKIKGSLNIKVEFNAKQKREDEKERKKDELDLKDMNINVGGKKFPIKISKCCAPKVNDEIIAFKTKDNKITIHKRDCVNVHLYDEDREIKVEISDIKPQTYSLLVRLEDRIGALAKVLSLISSEHKQVIEVNTRSGRDKKILLYLEILKNGYEVQDLIDKIKEEPDVIDAQVDNR